MIAETPYSSSQCRGSLVKSCSVISTTKPCNTGEFLVWSAAEKVVAVARIAAL